MAHIVTLNTPSREDWLTQLADVVTDPDELLRLLNIDADEKLLAGRSAKKLFALRVPRSFIDRMEKGDPDDPLLRQVLTSQDEFVVAPGFSTDPLEEQHSVVPGLLHKYHNRALLLVKGGCAVNCRYCFRRHFPYAENQGNKRNWQTALEYVAAHPELDEMIFSGGDPLHPQNVPDILKLVKRIRAECPDKDIWVWTGYKLDDLNWKPSRISNVCGFTAVCRL
jgi:KamA family protein